MTTALWQIAPQDFRATRALRVHNMTALPMRVDAVSGDARRVDGNGTGHVLRPGDWHEWEASFWGRKRSVVSVTYRIVDDDGSATGTVTATSYVPAVVGTPRWTAHADGAFTWAGDGMDLFVTERASAVPALRRFTGTAIRAA